jgi:hypothetical protein
MADDINGDKITDYYTHAEFAKRLSDITDEISPKKPKIKLSPLKVLIALFVITVVLTILSYSISHGYLAKII